MKDEALSSKEIESHLEQNGPLSLEEACKVFKANRNTMKFLLDWLVDLRGTVVKENGKYALRKEVVNG